MGIGKLFVAAVAALAMCISLSGPASAATAPVTAPGDAPVATCGAPPDTPEATPENRDRFVELWSARLADQAWLDEFNALDEVPADVLAEGFHALDGETQMWLNACLLDDMLATANESPGAAKTNSYLSGLAMVIFGKESIAEMRQELNKDTPADPSAQDPVPEDLTSGALDDMTTGLATAPSLVSADQPKADVPTTKASTSDDIAAQTPKAFRQQVSADPVQPQTSAVAPGNAVTAVPPATGSPLVNDVLGLPPVPALLDVVNDLLLLVSDIQGQLFTLPVLNLLSSVFYKVCAESPTMELSCSASLPVGLPVPADVTGDNFPDVLARLSPLTNLVDVGARLHVERLFPNTGDLPAHVFIVYDTPVVDRRIQVGFDGRSSSLARGNTVTFKLKDALTTVTTGDIQVEAKAQTSYPDSTSTQALTFAVKSLAGGSVGVQPTEEDPLAGSVQFSPYPAEVTVGAHFKHTEARSEDNFTVSSTTPTTVDAIIDQKTTSTPVESSRRFTARVDQLPTEVEVDLVREGEHQSIDYNASAPIDFVQATDTTTLDVTQPGSYTQSVYEVHGVPDEVSVDLQGSEDITYSASDTIPEAGFSTKTLTNETLDQQITATAHDVPKSIHVTNVTTEDGQAVTYDADSELGDIELGMYDRAKDRTNLVATATGIPQSLEFSQTTSTGAYDFSAPGGIDLIEASFTRNDGDVIPMPGTDHATVLKVGEALGVDFRLSGFESAHFDGHEDTTVELGLDPGGQSFDAIADLDDPNVLAKAHVSELPTDMAVTLSTEEGSATYDASSEIPELKASFLQRDTTTFARAKLLDIPQAIDLSFNTSGESPEVTYDASSRLGSINLIYSESPDGLAIKGNISDLPESMRISGLSPIVFDARSGPDADEGSSYLGQVLFQYATDGVFESPPTADDHIYLATNEVDATHAEVQYTGLKYLSVDTSDQELHAELRNASARLVRAYLTTPDITMTGFIDKVPATIELDQVDNLIQYRSSSPIDQVFTEVERANGDTIAAEVTDVPEEVDLLFDGAASQLDWTASDATGAITATAHLTPASVGGPRAFDAALTIASIPSEWSASWADGDVLFQAPAPGIGSISAQVTNHGSYNVLGGDHLTAHYDQSSGDLDASLRISNLRKAQFTRLVDSGDGGGFEAQLHMGNQDSFAFDAEVHANAGDLLANGSFDNLPSQITLRSDGGRITYDGNTNPDLTLSVAAGKAAALDNTPNPPSVHGVAVRDGASGSDVAVRAKLFLTGLPTSLDLNSPAGTYAVGGYNPSISTLVVDAVLTALAPEQLSLQLQQEVPTAAPVDFTFGPFETSTAPDGTHSLSLDYTASQTLGALTAEATYAGTDDAKLEISEIPSSINVTAGFGADQKTVGVAMSQGISDITASYKKVGATEFAASVHLHDVPSAVNLQLGRDTATAGGEEVSAPDFTFTASQAGLDIDAFASAEIAEPADITAAANLQVTNLGQTVTGQLEGTSLHITSSPATQAFLLEAAGSVAKSVDLDFSGGGFTNEGQLDVDVEIEQLTLGFQNTSDLRLKLGITTGLEGDFSNFTFGLDTDTEVHIEDDLDFFIDWPDPFGTSTIDLFDINMTIDFDNVLDGFHINSNTFGEIFSVPVFHFLVGDCSVDFDVRPGPGFTTSNSTLSLPAPPSEGSHTPAWLITPDLNLLGISLPDFALDLIAIFTSPYGNEFKVDAGCEVF